MEFRTYPCPACQEIIDTTMQVCRYCGAAIDPAAATAAADLQQRVQRACAEASSARITASTSVVFFLVSFLPFIGLIGTVGNLATLVIVPVQVVRWRLRFGRLESRDPDLPRARESVTVATIIWAVMLCVTFFWFFVRYALMAHRIAVS